MTLVPKTLIQKKSAQHIASPMDPSILPGFEPVRPALRPIFRVEAQLQAPATVGNTGMGVRKIIPIIAGVVRSPSGSDTDRKCPFAGAKLLSGGADYFLQDSAGTTRLDARYGFELLSGREHRDCVDQAHPILQSTYIFKYIPSDTDNLYVQSRGTRFARDEAAAQGLAQGDDVDPRNYYFRLRLELESDDPDTQVQEACRSMVVASAVRGKESIVYDAYILE